PVNQANGYNLDSKWCGGASLRAQSHSRRSSFERLKGRLGMTDAFGKQTDHLFCFESLVNLGKGRLIVGCIGAVDASENRQGSHAAHERAHDWHAEEGGFRKKTRRSRGRQHQGNRVDKSVGVIGDQDDRTLGGDFASVVLTPVKDAKGQASRTSNEGDHAERLLETQGWQGLRTGLL
ncbi:MAG: hypothetical protein ACI87A_002216, partial [Planctomycetota bacterium]